MPAKRLSMRKIKEVLRLKWERGLSNRQIAEACGVSRPPVSEYLQRLAEAGLNWPLPEDLSEARLEQLLFPPPPDLPAEVRGIPDCLATTFLYADSVQQGWHVVGMDRGLNPALFASVVSNDQDTAQALTHSVIGKATKRIAWLEVMPDLYISLERRAGFDAAFKGTAVKLLYLSASHHERSEGARLAAQLLDQEGGANALITASYVLLAAVFDVFFKRGGLSDNIRLATFGDHRLPNFFPSR